MIKNTKNKTAAARDRLTGQLRRADVRRSKRLASILDACSTTDPCRNAACPVCGAVFQQAVVRLIDDLIRTPARAIRNRTNAITIIPSFGILQPDDLSVEAYARVGTEIQAAFGKLGLPPAIIGLEASFNEDVTGRVPAHWCSHGHTYSLDWLSDDQGAELRSIFPSSPLVKRPIHYVQLDQDIRSRLYLPKWERIRRVTFLNSDDPNRQPFRDTKRRDLRPMQAVQLALVEHELGFGRRLLTHGIEESAVRQRLQAFGWARDRA